MTDAISTAHIDIRELLPQREPFIAVGRLSSFSMERVVSHTTVDPDSLFADQGRLSPAGIIENIAQTCAARIGYINKYILGEQIRIGFIGAIRHLVIHRLPAAGEQIETSVYVVEEIFGMTLVRATVSSAAGAVAQAEMKIALSDSTTNPQQ